MQFRYRKYTFQIGVLRSRGTSLMSQIEGRVMDLEMSVIRDWKDRTDA